MTRRTVQIHDLKVGATIWFQDQSWTVDSLCFEGPNVVSLYLHAEGAPAYNWHAGANEPVELVD